jgi:chromatin structure-remodeling complex subunit RSC3/30
VSDSNITLFKESTDHLGLAALHGTHGMNDETSDLNTNALLIEPSEVREGANLLRFLRDISVYQRIAEAWLRTTQESDFIGRPLVELTFQSLQGFSCALSPSCEPSTLSTRSLEIFHLFSSPIPIHSSLTFTDFMSSMSCRWEIIGLAFSFVGVGTVMPCDWDTMFQVDGKPVISRKELGILALSATETCLRFCNEARVLNDAVSWLFYQHTYFTTLIHGDRGMSHEPEEPKMYSYI